jgi:hypothetical protein
MAAESPSPLLTNGLNSILKSITLKTTVFTIAFLLLPGFALTQDAEMVRNSSSVTWFGFDYSEAYFIGSEGFSDPYQIKNRYFKSWNNLILQEPEKYDIGKFYRKSNVEYDLSVVLNRNEGVDIDNRIVDDHSQVSKLSKGKIQEMIREYKTDVNSQGLGLVYIVESYDKILLKATYFVTFFDIASLEVLETRKREAEPGGFGIRNYWASSYLRVMRMGY